MPRFQKHVFVCDNYRDPSDKRGCCSAKGSAKIIDSFKMKLKELGITSKIRANKSGCLDACEHGPVVLVYPEQIWYGNVKEEDVEEIIQSHLLNNKPVERLMIKDKKFL